jgi:putative flippase GtrA
MRPRGFARRGLRDGAQAPEIVGRRKWFNHCTTPAVTTTRTPRDPLRVIRALLAGGAATLADLAVLALLVSAMGLAPRVASIPALVDGGNVRFLGNRHFAFRASRGSLARQAALYTVVELAALGANGVLFDLAMRVLPTNLAWAYVPVRLVTSHLVFLGWSYPLWRLVFRVPREAEAV